MPHVKGLGRLWDGNRINGVRMDELCGGLEGWVGDLPVDLLLAQRRFVERIAVQHLAGIVADVRGRVPLAATVGRVGAWRFLVESVARDNVALLDARVRVLAPHTP